MAESKSRVETLRACETHYYEHSKKKLLQYYCHEDGDVASHKDHSTRSKSEQEVTICRKKVALLPLNGVYI